MTNKIVAANFLNSKQKDQLVEMQLGVGYFRFAANSCKDEESAHEFHKTNITQNVESFTRVVLNENQVIASYCGIEVEEFNFKHFVNVYQKSQSLKPLYQIMQTFLDTLKPQDYLLTLVAIHNDWRNQEIFRLLFEDIKQNAKNQGCAKVVGLVWEKEFALHSFINYGATINNSFNLNHSVFEQSYYAVEFMLN